MSKTHKKINKILLTQPDYSRFGKRTLRYYPYPLGIINACIKDRYETELYDPNRTNGSDDEIIKKLQKAQPDLVGLSTSSTEYINDIEHMASLIKKALPNVILVEGGIVPTTVIDVAMRDKNVDYWIIGEGERSFPKLAPSRY